MDLQKQEDWTTAFNKNWERYGKYYQRSETRDMAKNYVRGLLSDIPKKNGWQLAEAVGLEDARGLQRVMAGSIWDAGQMRGEVRQQVTEEMGTEHGIGVIDESGFVKWGDKSAGVSRQYCGRIGKLENCQVGVYLGYVTETSAAFLDCQLYLPKTWTDDRERCQAAQVPDELGFQTKPQIALAMLEQAWREGVPMQWVVGDSLYGNSPGLRNAIDEHGRYYVMALGSSHQALVGQAALRQDVTALADQIPATQWETLVFRLSEKGPLAYEWAAIRVSMPHDQVGEQWLIGQRSLGTEPTLRLWLSNAPDDIPLSDLAAVALARHPIEELIEEAKSELGMADYEVRYWSAWHRHMTLVMLAHTWLKLLQHDQRQKKAASLLVELQPG